MRSQPRARPVRRKGAFTVIELTLSTGIIAVAIMALVTALFTSIRLDELNRERLWARQECRRQIESVLALPFTSVPARDGVTFDVGFPVRSGGPAIFLKPPAGTAHSGLISVFTTSQGDAECYKVKVKARWQPSVFPGSASVELVVNVGKN